MEIINSEFRKNVLSYCCEKKVYLGTRDCSGCLEQCTFVIDKPIAFHKWLIEQSKGQDDPVQFLIELLRKMIIEDQNQMVFELMDWVDIGDAQYNRATLGRVATMLLDTLDVSFVNRKIKENKLQCWDKDKNNNKLN